MANPELGVKRRCLSCAAPFFDLNRTPILCPKCGAAFQIVELAHSRPKWAPTPLATIKTPAVVDPIEADAADSEAEDEDAEDESTILPIEEDDDVELAEIIEIDRDAAAPES